MAELIKVLFGLWAWMGPGNHALHEVQIPDMGRGNFGVIVATVVKYRDFLLRVVQNRLNRSICHLGCVLQSGK